MIENFANKVARDVWEKEWSRSFPTALVMRAKALLTIMHNTTDLHDLVIKGQPPNVRLHKLKGKLIGRWSVSIDSSWRMTFAFRRGRFYDVKIEDYHRG